MKKVFTLLFILTLILPLSVQADVGESTMTSTWEISEENAKNKCYAEEDKNNNSLLSKASTGWYLYCIEISCTNSLNVHNIKNPLSNKLTCSNGNTNPNVVIDSGSASKNEQLKSGATCDKTGVYIYATEKLYYNCAKTSSGSTFVPETPVTTPPTSNNSGGVTSPETGVEDYYLVLGSSILIISVVLYIINKKNVFKKI